MRTLSIETPNKLGQEVVLKGWVDARRNMGKIVFLDLRDFKGKVQIVGVPSELDERSQEELKRIRPEWVLEVRGLVNERGAKQKNPEMPTGTVEILAKEIKVFNEAKTPPFEVDKDTKIITEELRLKYRYLDLRSERMQRNLIRRDKIISFFRDWLHQKDFVEIETPILMKGTPEGAREFIVPSRLYSGNFYVLPQSPQQFKQLLMVSGFERYFQIARCFRDEDQRGDRQPEFTQLDYEMSFVNREDILSLSEEMFIAMIKAVAPDKKITATPFPRLTYAQAMDKYNTDKPDLRQDKNDSNELAFCWVVDFPMFEKTSDGSIQSMHHPFCSIHPEDMDKLDSDPLSARADSYDLVLNGYELSSGSIRIHERALQKKDF